MQSCSGKVAVFPLWQSRSFAAGARPGGRQYRPSTTTNHHQHCTTHQRTTHPPMLPVHQQQAPPAALGTDQATFEHFGSKINKGPITCRIPLLSDNSTPQRKHDWFPPITSLSRVLASQPRFKIQEPEPCSACSSDSSRTSRLSRVSNSFHFFACTSTSSTVPRVEPYRAADSLNPHYFFIRVCCSQDYAASVAP